MIPSRFELIQCEAMPPDEMPSEVIESARKPSIRNTVAVFVFNPVIEAAGTKRFWTCSAIMVWRGKLTHNRLIRALTSDRGGDTDESLASEYAKHITAIIDAGLSDVLGKGVRDE